MPIPDPDELTTLITTRHAFEAHVIVAVLQEAGIDARAFDAIQTSLPLAVGRLQQLLELAEAERIVHGQSAEDSQPRALMDETVELGRAGGERFTGL